MAAEHKDKDTLEQLTVTDTDIVPISLDQDNLDTIIYVIVHSLAALTDVYVNSFTEYLKYLSDSNPETPGGDANEFWQFTIVFFVTNLFLSLEEIHNQWCAAAESNYGWKWGTNFSVENKTCPLLQSFNNLTVYEASLVRLISGIIWALVLKEEVAEE